LYSGCVDSSATEWPDHEVLHGDRVSRDGHTGSLSVVWVLCDVAVDRLGNRWFWVAFPVRCSCCAYSILHPDATQHSLLFSGRGEALPAVRDRDMKQNSNFQTAQKFKKHWCLSSARRPRITLGCYGNLIRFIHLHLYAEGIRNMGQTQHFLLFLHVLIYCQAVDDRMRRICTAMSEPNII